VPTIVVEPTCEGFTNTPELISRLERGGVITDAVFQPYFDVPVTVNVRLADGTALLKLSS